MDQLLIWRLSGNSAKPKHPAILHLKGKTNDEMKKHFMDLEKYLEGQHREQYGLLFIFLNSLLFIFIISLLFIDKIML
jgi:hypothetical protein